MTRCLVISMTLAAAGCSGSVEKETRPSFQIDSTQPFRLVFGRGSGLIGLDTIEIDQAGRVVLHRMKQRRQGNAYVLRWETAILQLQPAAVAQVLHAVEANELMELHKAYHANVHDGTQWVFLVKQGKREKSVYFNNSFPAAITRFAKQLDRTLTAAGLVTVAWQPVSPNEARKQERELWDSIKR